MISEIVFYAGMRSLSDRARLSHTRESYERNCTDLVPHTKTGAVGEHARGNVHSHKLLEKKLGSIWDLDLTNARLVVARATLVLTFLDLSIHSLVFVTIT